MQTQSNEHRVHDLFLITCLELLEIWPIREAVENNKYCCYYQKDQYEKALLAYQRSPLRKVAITLSNVNKRMKAFKAEHAAAK